MTGSCSGCDSKWAGLAMAHCFICHRTFSTVANFDKHRSNGKCLQPAELGLVEHASTGVWKLPGDVYDRAAKMRGDSE